MLKLKENTTRISPNLTLDNQNSNKMIGMCGSVLTRCINKLESQEGEQEPAKTYL